jgi:hypothetical protein
MVSEGIDARSPVADATGGAASAARTAAARYLLAPRPPAVHRAAFCIAPHRRAPGPEWQAPAPACSAV